MRTKFKKCLNESPEFEIDEILITPERIQCFNQIYSDFVKEKKNMIGQINIALVLEGKSEIVN
jgi:hypothetical protein